MKDLKIMWIDDSEEWFNSQKDSLEVNLEDVGISVDFEYCKNANILTNKVLKQPRFEMYDIIFIDYSLSNNIVGDEIIKRIRDNDILVDIIFYSASKEKELIDKIKTNIALIDGLTIANKDNFIDKAFNSICKMAQKKKSITNMRGVLANVTSENDFVINSYIMENFKNISETKQQEILDLFLKNQEDNKKEINESIDSYKSKGKITSINKFLKEKFFPLELKYRIFAMIAEELHDEDAKGFNIEEYFKTIVSSRNKLSHKKLDICSKGSYLKYFDNLKQFNERICPRDCNNHSDENKISCSEWENIKLQAYSYCSLLTSIFNKLTNE
ncbi:hypothetical protein IJD15_02355 [bacterium]|nr:hypothetical protein [Clostridia bacterium]MBQ4078005.1 hypothetical protein [bacterium]